MADKKLAKKLAKMSEEERADFLEQQRLENEEKQKKKEEMLSRFLKEKLIKEEKATQLNMVKVQNLWRTIMRRSKTQELTKDVQVMRQTFERIVDRKATIVQSLAKDLEEAEQQYQVALRTHLQNMDQLMDFQVKRTKKLENEYQTELKTLKAEFDTERHLKISKHEQDMKDLCDVLYVMELKYDEREADAQQEFQSTMDELKNKNLEDTHALSDNRKAVVDDLWQEFQKETKQYKDNTEERKLRFEALKKKDEESAKTIARQMRKLQKLQENITTLKQRMAVNAKESDQKIKAIKEDRETILEHFRELKQDMTTSRDVERGRLTTLTLQSDAAMKEIQRKKDKGETILRFSEMCRKLETEEEKVLPFYVTSLSEEEQKQVASVENEPGFEALAQVMHEYSALENFWQRYNKVLLDKLALDREKQILENENGQLKALLKQYLDSISVNDEILSQSNPLFVVNSNTGTPPQMNVPVGDTRIQRVQRESVNVVEAAHVVKHSGIL